MIGSNEFVERDFCNNCHRLVMNRGYPCDKCGKTTGHYGLVCRRVFGLVNQVGWESPSGERRPA